MLKSILGRGGGGGGGDTITIVFHEGSRFKVQGSRFFIICHIHNHTGYNQSAQWTVQKK